MFTLLIIWLLQRNALKKIDKPHNGRYVSLNNAHRVGLLINAAEPGAYDCLSTFKAEIERRKLDYSIICLDLRKKSAQVEDFPESDKVLVLRRKQLKWYRLPKPEIIEAFAGKPFDIVLDFTFLKKYFPLEYLSRIAKTSLRLGISPKRTNDYDMIIQSGKTVEETSPETQTRLMKHILQYLNSVN